MIELINRKGIPTIIYKQKYNDEILEYVLTNKIKSICIGDGSITLFGPIDFLRQMKTIENVTITEFVRLDSNIFYELKIKTLELYIGEWSLDFDKLSTVEYVNFIYNKKSNLKGMSRTLEKLHITKYKQKEFDTFFDTNNIKELWLSQSQLESLKGLDKFPNLERLTITLSPKLIDIGDLKYVSKTLKYLELSSCKSLIDFSPLENLTNIEEFNVYNSGEILTTAYFKNLPNLHTLFLRGNTKVLKQNKNDVEHIKRVVIADMDLMIGSQ